MHHEPQRLSRIGGQVYYTMRLVRGHTLVEAVSEQRAQLADGEEEEGESWTLFRLLQVFVTVCRAVSYAHDRGLVHRDLKPSNIMIGAYGEVNVLDWGLAKFLGGAARDGEGGTGEPGPDGPVLPAEGPVQIAPGRRETGAGAVVGTPAFMAPSKPATAPSRWVFLRMSTVSAASCTSS